MPSPWRMEAFIARKKCKPEVAARIRRLNPNGFAEGSWPRGYRPASTSWWQFERGLMSPRDCVARYGRAAYDAIPRRAIKRNGHRKGVVLEYTEDCMTRKK